MNTVKKLRFTVRIFFNDGQENFSKMQIPIQLLINKDYILVSKDMLFLNMKM